MSIRSKRDLEVILSKLKSFEKPSLTLEQYPTPSHILTFLRRQIRRDLLFLTFSSIFFRARRKLTPLNAFLKRVGLLFSNSMIKNRKLFKFQELHFALVGRGKVFCFFVGLLKREF